MISMLLRNLSHIIISLLLICGLQSCNSKPSNENESGELIEILHSSGDDYSYKTEGLETFYAPYPFNHGILKSKYGIDYDIVILSKKVEKGKKIGVELFAKMTIVDLKGAETAILIARPNNTIYELCPISDFYDFSIEQFYLKQMVQYWYSNRFGLNGTIVKGWEPANIDAFKQ